MEEAVTLTKDESIHLLQAEVERLRKQRELGNAAIREAEEWRKEVERLRNGGIFIEQAAELTRLRAEVERLRGELRKQPAESLVVLDFKEQLMSKDAEIKRLRHEVKLREQICADATLYARRLQEADDEIERLQKLATQRGERMQIMREWMMPNDWRHFVITKPQAADWFDENGAPK